MRRAHRCRRLDGVGDPGLPLRDRDLGRGRSVRGRVDPGVQARSGARLELLSRARSTCFATRSRTRRTWRSPSSSGAGSSQAVVTQNIDLLHTRAGSRDVVEVHGSIRSAQCLGCLWTEPADAVLAQLDESPTPPCPQCGEVLKPGVVLFGELLPGGGDRARDAARPRCAAHARRRVVARGLAVAGLPLEARAFAIVNRGPTRARRARAAEDRRGRRRDARRRRRRALTSATQRRRVV